MSTHFLILWCKKDVTSLITEKIQIQLIVIFCKLYMPLLPWSNKNLFYETDRQLHTFLVHKFIDDMLKTKVDCKVRQGTISLLIHRVI